MKGTALGGYSAATLLSAPKHAPLALKLTTAGYSVHLQKNPGESVEHLLLKGLLWALLLPMHPDAACECDLGMRYRPDVVALDAGGQPCWWGECGHVKASKLADVATMFPNARISVVKYGRSDLRGYAAGLRRDLIPALRRSQPRAAPFELINFPANSAERFISDDGEVRVSFDDLQIVPLTDGGSLRHSGAGRRSRKTK